MDQGSPITSMLANVGWTLLLWAFAAMMMGDVALLALMVLFGD
jgi:hypothetical protein